MREKKLRLGIKTKRAPFLSSTKNTYITVGNSNLYKENNMGTRGFVGYKKNGEIKGWYNHYDSYISYLGKLIQDKIDLHGIDRVVEYITNNIDFADNKPNDGDVFYENHRNVWERDWGSDDPIILYDGGDFYKDGLFCEYCYIFDLDKSSIFVYKGFGDNPDPEIPDWYYNDVDKKYYMWKLLKIPFNKSNKFFELAVNAEPI